MHCIRPICADFIEKEAFKSEHFAYILYENCPRRRRQKAKVKNRVGTGAGMERGVPANAMNYGPLSLEMTTHESVGSSVDAAGAFFLKVSRSTLLRFAIMSVYYRSFSTSSLPKLNSPSPSEFRLNAAFCLPSLLPSKSCGIYAARDPFG